jgi:hypothetical protein
MWCGVCLADPRQFKSGSYLQLPRLATSTRSFKSRHLMPLVAVGRRLQRRHWYHILRHPHPAFSFLPVTW